MIPLFECSAEQVLQGGDDHAEPGGLAVGAGHRRGDGGNTIRLRRGRGAEPDRGECHQCRAAPHDHFQPDDLRPRALRETAGEGERDPAGLIDAMAGDVGCTVHGGQYRAGGIWVG